MRALCLAALAAAVHGFATAWLDAVADCGADPSGLRDSTAALQACLDRGYNTASVPPASQPVFLPVGTYLVNDTLVLQQVNTGGDDGINVVPSRYLANVLVGSAAAAAYGRRPVLKLAPNSAGFADPNARKPVVSFPACTGGGFGVNMNQLLRGIDLDLTAPGNPGAVGVFSAGAQGTAVHDVTVRAAPDTFACFQGCNGAGGQHANIACFGARVGMQLDAAQPVAALVGGTFVGQSQSALVFTAQETLSAVALNITLAPGATGPAISSPNFAGSGGYSNGMSIVDSVIACAPGNSSAASVAIGSQSTLYLRDVYVQGCAAAVAQRGTAGINGTGTDGAWLHVAEYAKGVNSDNAYTHYDVIYEAGQRIDGGSVLAAAPLPAGQAPPADLASKHLWDEATFPSLERGAVDARAACGAKGDDATDDWPALQACVNGNAAVFLPPGRFRLSRTLQLPPNASLVGLGNTVSVLAAATTGLAGAAPGSPVPLVATTSSDGAGSGAGPTTIAFVGITIFQHLADTYALDWATRHPASLWRVGYESRPCECLWTSDWRQLSPPAIPCAQPVNITVPKTVFRGLGRIHAWVTDDTGGILSTGAKYRHMQVRDTAGFAGPDARLRFYSLNLEHAQSEANGEVVNATWVDILSLKGEGNLPLLWVRAPAANVSVSALGGGFTPFPSNWTLPSDFTPGMTPAMLRADAGTGVTFAMLVDHGIGAQAPSWPPRGGGCSWEHHYPYPGQAVPAYPFGTWPNVTMWNCWFGYYVATADYFQTVYGTPGAQQVGTQPMDKPALFRTYA